MYQKQDDIKPKVYKTYFTDHFPIGLSLQNIVKPIIASYNSQQGAEVNYINLINEISREPWEAGIVGCRY